MGATERGGETSKHYTWDLRALPCLHFKGGRIPWAASFKPMVKILWRNRLFNEGIRENVFVGGIDLLSNSTIHKISSNLSLTLETFLTSGNATMTTRLMPKVTTQDAMRTGTTYLYRKAASTDGIRLSSLSANFTENQ